MDLQFCATTLAMTGDAILSSLPLSSFTPFSFALWLPCSSGLFSEAQVSVLGGKNGPKECGLMYSIASMSKDQAQGIQLGPKCDPEAEPSNSPR